MLDLGLPHSLSVYSISFGKVEYTQHIFFIVITAPKNLKIYQITANIPLFYSGVVLTACLLLAVNYWSTCTI